MSRKTKNVEAEFGEDIRKSIESLAEDVRSIKRQQIDMLALIREVQELKKRCDEKGRIIDDLGNRISTLEQQERINDVTVTGIELKPRSYARAVGGVDGGEEDELDKQAVEDQVIAALGDKGVSLSKYCIESCYAIKKMSMKDKSIVILKLKDRTMKMALLQQGKKLKGTNIYLNDHLTKATGEVARRARELRRAGKIFQTWTKDCKVYIKQCGSQDKVKVIRKLQELESF